MMTCPHDVICGSGNIQAPCAALRTRAGGERGGNQLSWRHVTSEAQPAEHLHGVSSVDWLSPAALACWAAANRCVLFPKYMARIAFSHWSVQLPF